LLLHVLTAAASPAVFAMVKSSAQAAGHAWRPLITLKQHRSGQRASAHRFAPVATENLEANATFAVESPWQPPHRFGEEAHVESKAPIQCESDAVASMDQRYGWRFDIGRYLPAGDRWRGGDNHSGRGAEQFSSDILAAWHPDFWKKLSVTELSRSSAFRVPWREIGVLSPETQAATEKLVKHSQ
jgi:hypothetical protein